MRKFKINVNGTSYNVEVEEIGGAAISAPVATPAPTTAPAAAVQERPAVQAQSSAVASPPLGAIADGTQIKSPMPGNILDVRVSVGDKVSEGDILVILEAMKMENEIMAPAAGCVVGVQVTKGTNVNSGDLLVIIA